MPALIIVLLFKPVEGQTHVAAPENVLRCRPAEGRTRVSTLEIVVLFRPAEGRTHGSAPTGRIRFLHFAIQFLFINTPLTMNFLHNRGIALVFEVLWSYMENSHISSCKRGTKTNIGEL